MKELKDYTVQQLKNAIYEKEMKEALDYAKTLPNRYLPYKESDIITNAEADGEYIKLYKVDVDDGCEGHTYIVQVNSNEYNEFPNEIIADTVKHHYLSLAFDEGWDDNLNELNFIASKIGYYGTTFLSVDGTEFDEDEIFYYKHSD